MIPKTIRLKRDYPQDPFARYTESPETVRGDYSIVDAAMVESVHIMNKVLGYETYACCEGHKSRKNPDNKQKINRGVKLLHSPPYSSYIAFYLPLGEHTQLIDFLLKNGFEEAHFGHVARGKHRTRNPGDPPEYVSYDRGAVLSYTNGGQLEGDRFMVRIGIDPEEIPHSQESWDKMRDAALETWLNMIGKFKNLDDSPISK
ncbi:hypothetical protein [Methanocella sp. MCL-LM]|uniref:hypothetical protein n=1 Tax=Methanocella sp. MCL-LM TaxID=3412035 RepID=UPI003C746F87